MSLGCTSILVILAGCYLATGPAVCQDYPAGPYGGDGGDPFNDVSYRDAYGAITAVRIRCDKLVDHIQFRYGDVWGPINGGMGGSPQEAYLNVGEYIVSVNIASDAKVDQVTFNTNMRSIGPCGGSGGDSYIAQGPVGTRLSYISGRSADVVDQVTFYFVNNV